MAEYNEKMAEAMPAASPETSSEEGDKLEKVLKLEVLRDDHDPDLGKSDEERAALVCGMVLELISNTNLGHRTKRR